MDSRMNKYYEESKNLSRVARNEELYKDLNKQELSSYEVKSNATVIGNHENEIDVEKIKKILDTRYKEAPRRKSFNVEVPEEKEETSIVPEATTKEYDLNTFLAKAKSDKEETYEEVRNKKLRDTQFDILSNLNLSPKNEEKEVEEKNTDDDLMNLINTITINEVKQNKEEDTTGDNPLDILTDLKGSDNTEVFEGIKETIEQIEKTSKVYTLNNSEERKVQSIEEVKKEEVIKPKEEKEEETIDNTFYSKTDVFNKKDFVDNEFADNEKLGIGIKILIALLILAFVAGLFLFLKTFINF